VWDIYGPILIVGMNEEEGDLGSLPEAEAVAWAERLNQSIFHRVVI